MILSPASRARVLWGRDPRVTLAALRTSTPRELLAWGPHCRGSYMSPLRGLLLADIHLDASLGRRHDHVSWCHSPQVARSHILRLVILKRGTAILLPICLVWLFVGCLAVCAGDVAHESEAEPDSFNSYVVRAGDLEACPISDGERTLLQETNRFARSLPSVSANFCSPLHNIREVTSANRSTILSFADPPLSLLGTLRI